VRNVFSVPASPAFARFLLAALLSVGAAVASAQQIFLDGFETLEDPSLADPPVLRVLRDDRVATVEMDYNADNPAFQFWEMSGDPSDDAGFLVRWWPVLGTELTDGKARLIEGNDGAACLDPDHFSGPRLGSKSKGQFPGESWLVTGNRRIQLQPLDNDRAYQLSVQRINALGQITSRAARLTFPGGDGTRVAQLRSTMTYFDDFNRPMGPVDERLWNNAVMTSTDLRYNQFFINNQLHVHTMHGTRVDNTGDKSQTSQRFRKRIRMQEGVRRRVVFDMDSPMSGRSVWYLDFNPVPTDVTGHASFFDTEGDAGLPAGVLRLRMGGQTLSVSLIDAAGASHRIASVEMDTLGRQAVPNVRRAFDVRVGTDGVQIFIDGRSAIDTAFVGEESGQTYTFTAGDYELLWVGFGYNTVKDGIPYYLIHWDNFGFDGPVVDNRVVHNYVTRITGNDYQKASSNSPASFTIRIPDDLRPTTAGATAEAWLVATYQMGDYSWMDVGAGDFVRVNGGPQVPMQVPLNNSTSPTLDPDATWGLPYTARIKIADLTASSAAPFLQGDNSFQFNAGNVGLLNVHLEVLYPPGSAPAYTAPSAIHHFPLHAEVPRFGPPVRINHVGTQRVGYEHVFEPEHLDPGQAAWIPVTGVQPLDAEVGNSSWDAGWAPQLMRVPTSSVEVWSTGGTTGIASLDVYLRRAGTGSGPGDLIQQINTAEDAPAPQGRYRIAFDSRAYPNGDYELFLQATTPSGLKSHPSYGEEIYHFGSENLSGAYRPVRIRIQN
jgi:hypothetical protein